MSRVDVVWSQLPIFDSYRALKLLGEGGEGIVFSAEHRITRQKVIVKQFRKPLQRHIARGLAAYADGVTPNRLGLPVIQLIGDNDRIYGVSYPYSRTDHVHWRVMQRSEQARKTLFGSFCRKQHYLMSQFGVGLWDAVASNFMLDMKGIWHFVDFGYGVAALDHDQCVERGYFGYAFILLLLSIHNFNLRTVLLPSSGYSFERPCVYSMIKHLDQIADMYGWVQVIVEKIRRLPASNFHDPEFYLSISADLPTELPYAPSIVAISRLLPVVGKVRKIR